MEKQDKYGVIEFDPMTIEEKEDIVRKRLIEEMGREDDVPTYILDAESGMSVDEFVEKIHREHPRYISQEEYEKRTAWQGSHSAVEGHLDKCLRAEDWIKFSAKKYKSWHKPDRVFYRDGVTLLIEVKPGNAKWEEVKKGIGEVMTLRVISSPLENKIPVLVCAIKWRDIVVSALNILKEPVWLMMFTEDGYFVPIIGDFI